MMRRLLLPLLLMAVATSTAAQRPIFEPDDFIDPNTLSRPMFLSRLVIGGVWNPSDRFRPIGGDGGVVVLSNSLHYNRFQLDYEHTEFAGVDESPPLQRCDCPDPVFFPTPPPANATPNGPSSERSETLQLGFYRTTNDDTLRYRFSWTRRDLDTVIVSPNRATTERRSGHDQSFTLDADTRFSLFGRVVWGTLYLARASRSGTADDDVQNEIAYVLRPPGFVAEPFLIRARLAVGGISGRGATGLNLVNPYVEVIWRHERLKTDIHIAWSGEITRSGAEGWRPNHQVAVFLDRTLFVKIFGGE